MLKGITELRRFGRGHPYIVLLSSAAAVVLIFGGVLALGNRKIFPMLVLLMRSAGPFLIVLFIAVAIVPVTVFFLCYLIANALTKKP